MSDFWNYGKRTRTNKNITLILNNLRIIIFITRQMYLMVYIYFNISLNLLKIYLTNSQNTCNVLSNMT